MKSNIFILSLITGMIANALAQPSPSGATTNKINLAGTTWSSGYGGNYGATNWNGGMTNGDYGHPYAIYTNPYYTYASTNVLYTNPYYIFARTNAAYVNPNWSNPSGNMHFTNNPVVDDLSLKKTNTVHHWWNW